MADNGPSPRAVEGVEPTNPDPCRQHGSGAISIATYNALDGRKGGLESAARALDLAGVHIAVVQETKFSKAEFATKQWSGYKIRTGAAGSINCGGISLLYKEGIETRDLYRVENDAVIGTNVIAFELITGTTARGDARGKVERYYVVGCYIPPSDTDGTTRRTIERALEMRPKGSVPLVIGDLNANLEFPRDRQEEILSTAMGRLGLSCITNHYTVRGGGPKRRRRTRGRWTWQQKRTNSAGEEYHVRSKPDFFLCGEETRRRFTRIRWSRPPQHNSDHRALIAKLKPGVAGGMKRYRRGLEACPHKLPKYGPWTEAENAVEVLQGTVVKPAPREFKNNQWIRPGTWTLVDQRAGERRAGNLTQAMRRDLSRQIAASLKADRVERARRVGESLMGHLQAGDAREAWRSVQGWYKEAGAQQAKRCHNSMEVQTVEREELYARVPPPGGPIPCNVPKTPINDVMPSDAEIRGVVKALRNGRAGNTRGMKAEHLKQWLSMAESEEKSKAEGGEGYEGRGDTWRIFVRLVQHVWETGDIPRQMRWVVVVLLPKGNSGDFRGIGLLDPVWKVMEKILDGRLANLECHDCLHGFLANRGCGTAILETKLAQQLAFLEQAPMYGGFIDLRKAFDAMDRGRCIQILRDRGVGEKALRLITTFWREALLACRAGGSYGRVFKALRGVTQGGPLSPRIFNIMVDAVVREWLRQIMSDEVAIEGIGDEIRTMLACFYADDGLVACRDPDLLQRALDALTALFDRVGLRTNTKKTECMTFLPGKIRTCLTEEGYRSRMDAEFREVRAGREANCDLCGKTMAAGSMRSHLETQHDTFRSFVLVDGDEEESEGCTFEARRDIAAGRWPCPVPSCLGGGRDPYDLRRHFRSRHPRDLVAVRGETSPGTRPAECRSRRQCWGRSGTRPQRPAALFARCASSMSAPRQGRRRCGGDSRRTGRRSCGRSRCSSTSAASSRTSTTTCQRCGET
jgi:hypothetical protein